MERAIDEIPFEIPLFLPHAISRPPGLALG